MINKKQSKFSGFTLVEALIVTVIACSLMIAIQAFFSHAVRVTLKGQDNLDSIRAASQLFSSLRKDMLQFVSLSTGGAKTTINPGDEDIPATATFSKILALKCADETITYSLVDSGGKNFVERVSQSPSSPVPKRKHFGVPRMKDFGVLYVKIPNKINSIVKNVGQVLVKITLDSEDERFPSKEINLSSLFFSERLADSDWNYLDF
ncbi:MAG: hypothetical protein Kow0029_31290 [Candidatus Rifleibacteriota bacterium]